MNIGNKIKTIRKDKKLTQKEFGKLIGKSEISVRKYEANSNVPLDVILEIAKVFELDAASLIPTSDNLDNSFKKYLESKNYYVEDLDLLNEIEHHVIEYVKFKIYEKKLNLD